MKGKRWGLWKSCERKVEALGRKRKKIPEGGVRPRLPQAPTKGLPLWTRAPQPQVPAVPSMWHPLWPTFCVTTVLLCFHLADSGHANSTGPGGLALTEGPELPLAEGGMAASPAPGHDQADSSALSPQCHRAEAPHAWRGGHRAATKAQGFRDVAPSDKEVKGGPMVAFVMEVGAKLWRKMGQAEQGAVVLQDERCFWSNAGSFGCCDFRCFTCHPDLLYYSLILPICKVASFLVTILTGIHILARCTKRYRSWRWNKHQSKGQHPEIPPSKVWGAFYHPQCAICLQAYKPGEALKLLSCTHTYHGKCIDLWHCAQPGSKTCPLCLRSVTTVALIPLHTHISEQE